MNGRTIAISAAVAAICAGILVVFTDAELSLVRWFSCGPLAPEADRTSAVCRDRD